MHAFCGDQAPGAEEGHGSKRVCTHCKLKRKSEPTNQEEPKPTLQEVGAKLAQPEPSSTEALKSKLKEVGEKARASDADQSVSGKKPAKKARTSNSDQSVSKQGATKKPKTSNADQSVSKQRAPRKPKTSNADQSASGKKATKKTTPSNADQSGSDKKPSEKSMPGDTDQSVESVESLDRVGGSTWKLEDRVVVLWSSKTEGSGRRRAKPAEVHQAEVTGVIPPKGWKYGVKKRKRDKFHYTLSYRDGDCSGRAGPNEEWDSDSLQAWPWSDDGESTDEDLPHRWH
jgi:hypothetical protein